MASICENAISILSGNLTSGRSYLITAVHTCKEWHVFDDSQSDSPFGVFGKFYYGGKERLGQLLNTNHLIDAVQVRNDI